MANAYKHQLEVLLEKRDLIGVFRELSQFFRRNRSDSSNDEDKMRSLWSEFNDLEEELSIAKISQDDFEKSCDNIIHELQNIINDLPEEEKPSRPRSSRPPRGRIKRPSKSSSIFNKIKDKFWPEASKIEVEIERPWDEEKMAPSIEEANESYDPFDPFEEEMATAAPPEAPLAGSPIVIPSPSPVIEKPVQSPFQKGKVLYAIPSQMCIGKASRCKVRIAPEQISITELEGGLTEEEKGAAKNETIKITQVMKVELVEANNLDNFDIAARSSVEQPILPFGFTEWAFDVTAKRPGHYALLLRVSAKINIPNYGERAIDVAILDRAILVSTTDQPTEEDVFAEQTIPDPDWDENDEKIVLRAIERGCMDEAIERIANFVQDKDRDFHTELILLHSRWNDNTNQLTNKLITAADWDIVNNKVRFAITQLLDQLKVSFPPNAAGTTMDWEGEKAKLTL